MRVLLIGFILLAGCQEMPTKELATKEDVRVGFVQRDAVLQLLVEKVSALEKTCEVTKSPPIK